MSLPEPYHQEPGITVYHADCLDVLPHIGRVDHVITDPPYAQAIYDAAKGLRRQDCSQGERKRRGHAMLQLADGAIGSIDEILELCALEFGKICQRWCIVFSDIETCHIWRARLLASGLRYVRTGAWIKPDAMPQMTGDRPSVGFEPATIAHAQGKMRWNGGGLPARWTHCTSKGDARPDHPCPKPLPLMSEILIQFTDPNDLILDPFAGSGTTGRACKDLGRRCILIEKEERHCETIVRRLAQEVLF